jgi:hypothetical protein
MPPEIIDKLNHEINIVLVLAHDLSENRYLLFRACFSCPKCAAARKGVEMGAHWFSRDGEYARRNCEFRCETGRRFSSAVESSAFQMQPPIRLTSPHEGRRGVMLGHRS